MLEDTAAHKEPEYCATKSLGKPHRVVRGPVHECAVGAKTAVGDNHMYVRVPVGERAVGLDAGHDADREIGLTSDSPDRGRYSLRSDTSDIAEQLAPVEAPGAEALGDGEYHLPLRNSGEESFFQPEGPERQAPGVATGAEVPRLAGEGE